MRLKQKSALIILGSFLAFGIAAFAFFHFYLLREFTKLEDQQATRNIARVSEALQQEIRALIERTRDWAVWDDAYSFVVDNNPAFVESNLTYEAVKSIQFDQIVFLSKPDKISYAIQLDFTNGTVGTLSDSALAALVTSSVFAPVLEGAGPGGGIVEIDGDTFLAAASPITDSAESKAPNGILVFTRRLSDDIITRIGEQTRLNVTRSVVSSTFRKERTSNKQRLDPANAFVLQNISRGESELVGHLAAYDLFGNNVFNLQIPMSRDLFFQGIRIRNYVAAGLGMLGLLTAVVVILLTHKLVIERVSHIGRELGGIANEQVFSRRIPVIGSDELGNLAQSINYTLEALDHAQQESLDARQVAETANAAKSAFIAKVSHELRTPIASITGMHRMILKRDISKPIRDLITTADRSAWDLLSIINEILDFSKAESGQLTIESIAFNVRDVLRDTVSIIAGRLEDKNSVELICDVHTNLPELLIGDPTKLKQVLVNLLGNAAKFTERGYVTLAADREDGNDLIRFRISDTGVGIPAAKLSSIFEPFKQADESVARNYQGTGLGLAIVKQFVEVMGGTVSVESQSNSGTTFTVLLPMKAVLSTGAVSTLNSSSWPATLLFGETSHAHNVLLENLRRRGVSIQQIDPFTATNPDGFPRHLHQSELIVISEQASHHAELMASLADSDSERKPVIVIMAKASSVELRESLHQAGFNNIFATPLLPDDILTCFVQQRKHLPQECSSEKDVVLSFSRKLHILIADDMPTNRLILEDLLEEAGHTVTSVADGKALVECISRAISTPNVTNKIDIVITDITMPIMDGYAATRAVRELEQKLATAVHIPIIAVTAHALEEEHQQMRAAGVDGIIAKPIRPEEIAAEFERLIK